MPFFRPVVEHVYLTDSGGTPLAQLSRPAASSIDPDLIAAMFRAVQAFMDDSFATMGIGSVRSIELKGYHVAFGRGRSARLYVVYRGRESNRLEQRVEEVVREVDERFESTLKQWDGDVKRLAGLRDYLAGAWKIPLAASAPTADQAAELLELDL